MKPQPPERTAAEQIKLARDYGAVKGYYGSLGGWIYAPHKQAAVCQGWFAFYRANWYAIEAWNTRGKPNAE